MVDISALLKLMVQKNASDLYISVDSEPMIRVEGVLQSIGEEKLLAEDAENLAKSVMTEKEQAQFEEYNEQNLALSYQNLGRFRVNIFRQKNVVGMVIRHIKSKIPTIEELNLPNILKDIVSAKRGLVLVVGATGSGKSTTLASMIDYRNSTEAGHILSIEDPIEFVHEHKKSVISQREVGMDTKDYQTALKNALRQAPDVVLIGEIRDEETMASAIHFSETGHLCLATLHSNNANQAIERIVNFFPSQKQAQVYMDLSLNLKSVISQRLVPTIDGKRIVAFEILLDSPRVKDLIFKGEISSLKEAIEKGSSIGMKTFDDSLYDLYKNGKISFETALKNADSENNLRLKIKLEEDSTSISSENLRLNF